LIHYQYHTIKLYDLFQFRKEKPASGQNEVRADIFSGSLAVCLFASASRRGGRKGGVVFALPPAEPIVRNFGSDIFKYTPPIFRIRILGDCCLAPPEAGRGGKLVVYKLAVPFG